MAYTEETDLERRTTNPQVQAIRTPTLNPTAVVPESDVDSHSIRSRLLSALRRLLLAATLRAIDDSCRSRARTSKQTGPPARDQSRPVESWAASPRACNTASVMHRHAFDTARPARCSTSHSRNIFSCSTDGSLRRRSHAPLGGASPRSRCRHKDMRRVVGMCPLSRACAAGMLRWEASARAGSIVTVGIPFKPHSRFATPVFQKSLRHARRLLSHPKRHTSAPLIAQPLSRRRLAHGRFRLPRQRLAHAHALRRHERARDGSRKANLDLPSSWAGRRAACQPAT